MKVRAPVTVLIIFLSIFVILPCENTNASGSYDVVINEIMYNPEGSDSQKEWIEIYNNGSISVNVTNWILTDQDGPYDFIFPELSFPADTYIVIHSGDGINDSDFSDGFIDLYMFVSGAFLENSGDDILIMNFTGDSVDYVGFDHGTYVDPCPFDLMWDDANAKIENEGRSISLHPNGMDRDKGIYWEESDPSPGRANCHLDDDSPVISSIHHSPQNPRTFESVTISANVTDDYDLESVFVNYSLDGLPQPPALMIFDGVNYTFDLPALGEGTLVDYCIVACDDAQQIEISNTRLYAHSDVPFSLVINEILPNPQSDWNSDSYFDSDDEWIELYNKGDYVINIGGWKLDDKLGFSGSSDPYVIPHGCFIRSNEYKVFYGGETKVILNNYGEENVTLIDEKGSIIDIYHFNLTSHDTALGRFPDGSNSWKNFLLPTPGAENHYTIDSLSNLMNIKINEFLPTPKVDFEKEWIELVNTGSNPVRLDGCFLDDERNSGTNPWQIPLNTTLHPGGVVLFERTFGLNNDGDTVNLYYVDGSSIIDSFTYDSSEYDISWGRNSDGQDNWLSFSSPTPGDHNPPFEIPDVSEKDMIITQLFYRSAEEAEFFCLYNPSDYQVDLGGWRISDGRYTYSGSVIFPKETNIGAKDHLYVANNAIVFYDMTGFLPDCEYGNSSEFVPQMHQGVPPSFAMTRDEIRLLNQHGILIDLVAYGDSEYEGEGWMGAPVYDVVKGEYLRRNIDDAGYYEDTNTSLDWKHVRQYKPGQSDFEAQTFSYEGKLTVFSSPDSSYETLITVLDSAESSILIGLYEFTNWNISQKIIEKLNFGVSVRILMEGSPVGGITDEQKYILQKIHENGGEIRFMVTNSTLGPRYNFLHGKYAVLDETSVIVSSENWKYSGYPLDATFGNRGWGVVIKNSKTASYISDVFYSDWESVDYDIVPFTPSDPDYGNASSDYVLDDLKYTGDYNPEFPSKSIEGSFNITPVLSPDTTLSGADSVLELINSATETIYIEQLEMDLSWNDREIEHENKYLNAAISAAQKRHVEVRILLSSSFSYPDNPNLDNYDTCVYINNYAQNHNISRYLEARLVDYNRLGISKLHNKGMIVDGDKTLISSINWVRNSVAQNREVGLIIESKEVGDYFTKLFLWDWNEPPMTLCGPDLTVNAKEPVMFSGISSDSDDDILSYFWDFDDGTNSTEKNPLHIFKQEGVYNVRLTVSDGQYSDTDTAAVIVLEAKSGESESGIFVYGTLLFIFLAIFIIIIAFVRKMRYTFL